MEDDSRREEINEVTGGMEEDGATGQQESGSDNQYQQLSRPSSSRKRMRDETDSSQHDRKPSGTRSRSRSRKPLQRRQWRSANAFLNFMQDFRQNYNKMKSRDLFRLGGQTWRQMSPSEKMPYVEAAKLAQQQSQQNTKSTQQNKPNSSDSSKKLENQRVQKKNEREERKESRQARRKKNDSDVESDSATSGTGATITSEDVSDLSS
ncbi:hypothetical protein ALC56_09644 [Trachymyrmex septentrionalis]|uniref:HMG box domain-containing protein n=1 Tax=Trachymyrmex septentrionalis TaxID=34720 RepID=A0A195F5V5_9HYME|nr:PREDICTED: high mobility group B protein 2-like isoform X2 [Trachymyrmex septentrionalis]KYN35853.1 hypothetical protein ALC56_09644 [Trachymyrmex septentrionalis]